MSEIVKVTITRERPSVLVPWVTSAVSREDLDLFYTNIQNFELESGDLVKKIIRWGPREDIERLIEGRDNTLCVLHTVKNWEIENNVAVSFSEVTVVDYPYDHHP